MRLIKFFISVSFFVLNAHAQNLPGINSKTLSGAPRNSDLIFHFKRICIAEGLTGGGYVLPKEPSLEIGAFRAEYDLDRKKSDQSLQPVKGFKQVEFAEHAIKVNKRSFGAKEYIFEEYTIKVPVEELEHSMSMISTPKSTNMLEDAIDIKSGKNRDRTVQLAGFYVKIENVRSFVAFDGTKSHLSDNLKAKEKDEFLVYERLWPRFATMLGTSRALRSEAGAHISHLDPPSDCATSTNFDYTVEVVERPDSNPIAPEKSVRTQKQQGIR